MMPRERAATASVSPELLRLPFEGRIEAGENNIVELERKLHFIVTDALGVQIGDLLNSIPAKKSERRK